MLQKRSSVACPQPLSTIDIYGDLVCPNFTGLVEDYCKGLCGKCDGKYEMLFANCFHFKCITCDTELCVQW